MQWMGETKKYASFGYRIFASTIDSFFSLFLLYPLMELYNKYVINLEEVINLSNAGDVSKLSVEERMQIINASIQSLSMQSLILLLFVVVMWVLYSATPGKIILGMKIVDAKTGNKPGNFKWALRLLGYIVSTVPLGFGFVWIYYDKKCQGWHDKIAGTVVIIEQEKNYFHKLFVYLESKIKKYDKE